MSSVFTFTGLNHLQQGPLVSAQTSNSNPIQIISASTHTDDLGNFHVIGEVNNTSTQSQTNIAITAILSDTTSNFIVGNHSAFSSISTLRQGELSPFDIIIQDPQQILGKFNFIEFSAASQTATEEKPANLVINGTSSFLDNTGDPHIIGNIINKGPTPEQFLNLVATFYDNSSLGVIGTQTFGLNVENLANNQMAPFDITITNNKTKSQGAFYSLNVESNQSAMSVPLNTKASFVSTGGFANGGGDGFVNNSPINNQPGLVNSNDDDSNTRDNDDDDDDNDDDDNQRGEKKTDDDGNPWFDDENCSEKSGSSGGSSSECEEAEREEESEREDEDSLEKDQGPPSNSNSDSPNNNNDESEDNVNDSNGDEKIEDSDASED
ncbi:hypothetical protein [Candidatus Nitrosocosmicus hydrocola]|uniref:hypothetical protein n=1 Tax=Candidatus Nitrosocosmicus hydrocola TaxID=1826872 RepID=UPI0011E5ED19|nr:hypothetical protein [Candidatus Nitrosocosmicus hydrocola]